MDDEEKEIREKAKSDMLQHLDEITRKVSTGEIIGISIVADTANNMVVRRMSGVSPTPIAILIIEELGHHCRQLYLNSHRISDDGKPRLTVALSRRKDEERDK